MWFLLIIFLANRHFIHGVNGVHWPLVDEHFLYPSKHFPVIFVSGRSFGDTRHSSTWIFDNVFLTALTNGTLGNNTILVDLTSFDDDADQRVLDQPIHPHEYEVQQYKSIVMVKILKESAAYLLIKPYVEPVLLYSDYTEGREVQYLAFNYDGLIQIGDAGFPLDDEERFGSKAFRASGFILYKDGVGAALIERLSKKLCGIITAIESEMEGGKFWGQLFDRYFLMVFNGFVSDLLLS